MTYDQKKGLKSLVDGLGVMAILIGALTRLYDVIIGVIIALAIWIIGGPILRMMGLYPEKGGESKTDAPEENSTSHKKTSLGKMVVTVGGVVIIVLLIVSYLSVKGSGNLTTKDQPVANFNRVELSGSGILNINHSGTESLRIEAEDNLIKHIEAKVENNTLKLRVKNPWFFWTFWPARDINYYLSVDDLERVSISGSGTINTSGLQSNDLTINTSGSSEADLVVDVKNLNIDVSGSGKFTLAGKATSQYIEISGSGSYNAKDLVSQTASIKISGSGSGVLNAAEELSIDISGSGKVQYIGSPSISQKISGSGSISQYSGSRTATNENNNPNKNTNTTTIEIPQDGEYACIRTANCMPIVPEEKQWICSNDYLNWAEENCPDFQVTR